MPFRIRPDFDFTDQFRRVATDQLERAITVLEQRPDGAHAAVHGFRKNVKRLRSLYRLVAKEAPDFQKRQNARLRDAAKSLSSIRDAAALIGTAEYLQKGARGDAESEALSRIVTILQSRRDWMVEAESGLEQKLHDTAVSLKDAITAVDKVSFKSNQRRNARMLAKSWQRTLRRARTALDACRDTAAVEDFHELRKRTYDYRLYHALLRNLWPAAMKAKQDAAKDLAERLGHVNDLSVLSQLVEAEPQLFTRNEDLAHLLDAIIFRQQEERQSALADAGRVFADKPQDEANRIEALWLLSPN
ncbi:CHAD domain-containing protein [Rhizobium mongolense subsp. loessense]|uniref:CHAD domain-containing protein n=1 Tax=Rhizobium mongolense subsp. loessense TaxID=158890 RepID=A0A1G4SYQ7_9HYPH|nr:CHAD domain-containing protein [Rhizobium mongolense]SCW74283.1 CHAD domain-containing protein [Rhizobium mongolense subsp. loessense]